MTDDLKQQLLAHIHTVAELNVVRGQIGRLEEHVYQVEQEHDFATALESAVSANLAQIITQRLEKGSEAANARASAIKAVLADVRLALDEVTHVRITTAVAPSQRLQSQAVSYLRTHLDPHAVLSVSVDPQIIGGSIITFGGQYKNFSLRKQLNEYFAKSSKFK